MPQKNTSRVRSRRLQRQRTDDRHRIHRCRHSRSRPAAATAVTAAALLRPAAISAAALLRAAIAAAALLRAAIAAAALLRPAAIAAAALLRAAWGRPLARVEARDAGCRFRNSFGHGSRRARAKLEASSTVCRLCWRLSFF